MPPAKEKVQGLLSRSRLKPHKTNRYIRPRSFDLRERGGEAGLKLCEGAEQLLTTLPLGQYTAILEFLLSTAGSIDER